MPIDYLKETIDMFNKAYISGATATDAYSKAQAGIIKKLERAFEIAVRHVGYHHSQDDLYAALKEEGLDHLLDDIEDASAWGGEESPH